MLLCCLPALLKANSSITVENKTDEIIQVTIEWSNGEIQSTALESDEEITSKSPYLCQQVKAKTDSVIRSSIRRERLEGSYRFIFRKASGAYHLLEGKTG